MDDACAFTLKFKPALENFSALTSNTDTVQCCRKLTLSAYRLVSYKSCFHFASQPATWLDFPCIKWWTGCKDKGTDLPLHNQNRKMNCFLRLLYLGNGWTTGITVKTTRHQKKNHADSLVSPYHQDSKWLKNCIISTKSEGNKPAYLLLQPGV